MRVTTVRALAVTTGLVAAATASGIAITFLSLSVALVSAFLVVAAIVLLMLRRATRIEPGSRSANQPPAALATQSDVVRLARWFFYAGAGTTGFLLLRPIAGLTLSDLLFAGGLFLIVGLAIRNGESTKIPFPIPVMVGLIIFLIGAFAASFVTSHTVQSLFVTIKFAYLFVGWSWLSKEVLRDRRQVDIATRLWLCSAAISGLAGVLQITVGLDIPGAQNTYGRVSGLTGHVNDLGGVCAIALVVAVASALSHPEVKWRYFDSLLALSIAAGLIFSGSVGSMAAAAAGLVVWAVTVDRVGMLVLKMVAILVIVMSVWALVPVQSIAIKSPIYRLREVTGQVGDSASLNTRTNNYGLAWNAMADNPFIGHGLDSVGRLTSDGDPVHNLYLGSFFESGLFGLIGIVVIMGSLVVWFLRRIRQAQGEQRRQSLQLFASFVAFMIFSLSAPTLYQRYGWTPVILLPAALGEEGIRSTSRKLVANLKRIDTQAAPLLTRAGSPATRSVRSSGGIGR